MEDKAKQELEEFWKKIDAQEVGEELDILGDGKVLKTLMIKGTGERPQKDQECLGKQILEKSSEISRNA